jgi:hypothetical protein
MAYYKEFYNSFKMRSKYCFYDCDEPLDKIAFNGKCRIFVPGYLAYDIKSYRSKILNKPTYKEIFMTCCDDYYEKTGNENDIFFTDIFPFDYDNDDDNNDNDNNNDDRPLLRNPEKVYLLEMRMEEKGDRMTNFLMSL